MKNNHHIYRARVKFKPAWIGMTHIRVVVIEIVNSLFTLCTQVNIRNAIEGKAIINALLTVTTVTVHLLLDALDDEFGDYRLGPSIVKDPWATKDCLSAWELCISIGHPLEIDKQLLIGRIKRHMMLDSFSVLVPPSFPRKLIGGWFSRAHEPMMVLS